MMDETINGKAVSEEQIGAWANQAEAGYPIEQLLKRGRKPLGDRASTVVPVRMEESMLEALEARAEIEHVSRSEAIRAAVRAWLAA
jgi:hypothetical protein